MNITGLNPRRIAATFVLVSAASLLMTGCISIERSASPDAADITRMGEEATKVCGEGRVKEVTSKNYTCK